MISDLEIQARLAANLRQSLMSRKWSGRRLAEESTVSPMMVSRILRGISMPHFDHVVRFAEALDTSIDRLVQPVDTAGIKPTTRTNKKTA